MKTVKTTTKLDLNAETIRQLSDKEIAGAKGAGMCSTAALTGTCPTQSETCPVTH